MQRAQHLLARQVRDHGNAFEPEAQLGVTYVGAEESDGLETRELHVEELVLVLPMDDARAGTSLRTRALQDLPLVVPPGGYCLRGGVDAALAEAGARQHVVAEITAIEAICAAVRAGMSANSVQPSASAIAGSTAPSAPSIFAAATPSARVGPRLTTAIGTPSRDARSMKRRPE